MRWRWARDNWDGKDKLAHLLGGLVWVFVLGLVWRPWAALLSGLLFWWAWEVKDAYLPWEKAGWFGGDGFSFKDGLASTIGAVAGWAVLEIFTFFP